MRIAFVLVFVAKVASADPAAPSPVTASVGVGFGAASIDGIGATAALHVDVGYRVHRDVSLGLHLGTSPVSVEDWDPRSMFDVQFFDTYWPLQIGVGGTYASGRWWASPWLGAQFGIEAPQAQLWHYDDGRPPQDVGGGDPKFVATPRFAMGAAFGADVARWGENRMTIFASLSHALAGANPLYIIDNPFTSAVIGVGGRFWE